MKPIKLCLLLLMSAILTSCGTTGSRHTIKGYVVVDKSQQEAPDNQILNVAIEVFDPGKLPEKEKKATGLSMDIRKAEARYMPEELRSTMEGTGYWGAVRVVPRGVTTGELFISGTILKSDGENLSLQITARDASGRQWFNSEYHDEVDAEFYQPPPSTEEAFQPLYNSIANDLAQFLKTLSPTEITSIRRVAELRFAQDIAPATFDGYLQLDEDGRYTVVRLPSHDDPMYARVLAIQERDLLMVDTLNGHFDNFHREMEQPYTEWRKARSDEAEKLRKLEKEALNRTLLGVAAIVGAIFIGVASDGYNPALDTVTDVMVLGGAAAIKSGFDKRSEAEIHRDSIAELGVSFSSEAQPLVVEVDGKAIELTGSAETQYEQWRKLMTQIYASETGLSGTPN
jgi:hypothetical protein